MSEVLIFGCLSGTEPMENMHHTSLAVRVNDNIYVFDAGEGCGREAHLMGANLLNMKAIFISHPHIDHIGGLANLIWVPRKLTRISDAKHITGNVDIYSPDVKVVDSAMGLLCCDNPNKYADEAFNVTAHREGLGEIYKNEDITVTTFVSNHIPFAKDGLPNAYTFRIETEGKRIVFSGDVATVWDCADAIGDHCDLFLMETGHHQIPDICEFVNKHNIDKLVLTHHGRKIINDRPGAYEQLKACKVPSEIAVDRMLIKL